MALEFSGASHFVAHRMSVDAYMAQHPSKASRAAVQSVWVHLVGLCLTLERGAPPAYVARVMAKITAPRPELAWLEPPAVGGTLTVASVSGGEGPEAYQTAVRAWGASVWEAWTTHHERVRALVDANPG
jgi:hypothetical protein